MVYHLNSNDLTQADADRFIGALWGTDDSNKIHQEQLEAFNADRAAVYSYIGKPVKITLAIDGR